MLKCSLANQKNSILKRWNYRFKEIFSVIFLSSKNNKKKQTGFAWNYLQPPILACWGTSIPYLKINLPFFYCPFIFEEYLNPQVSINQMVNIVSTGYVLEKQGLHAVWIDKVYYSLFRRWTPLVGKNLKKIDTVGTPCNRCLK